MSCNDAKTVARSVPIEAGKKMGQLPESAPARKLWFHRCSVLTTRLHDQLRMFRQYAFAEL